MASVAEVRAQLAEANERIAEAMVSAQTAASKFDEARAVLAAIEGMAPASLGTMTVLNARELCEQAFVHGHAAIEVNTAYGAQL